MGKGVIRLLRTPLREGEPAYAITNVDQGLFVDGAKKGEKMPRTHRHASILEDGRMLWELPDTELNRKLAESMLPTAENPPFAYSVEYPEDYLDEGEVHEITVTPDHVPFADPQPKPKKVKVKGTGKAKKNRPQPVPPAPKGAGAQAPAKETAASGGK
jgi:hypothetical protein